MKNTKKLLLACIVIALLTALLAVLTGSGSLVSADAHGVYNSAEISVTQSGVGYLRAHFEDGGMGVVEVPVAGTAQTLNSQPPLNTPTPIPIFNGGRPHDQSIVIVSADGFGADGFVQH